MFLYKIHFIAAVFVVCGHVEVSELNAQEIRFHSGVATRIPSAKWSRHMIDRVPRQDCHCYTSILPNQHYQMYTFF